MADFLLRAEETDSLLFPLKRQTRSDQPIFELAPWLSFLSSFNHNSHSDTLPLLGCMPSSVYPSHPPPYGTDQAPAYELQERPGLVPRSTGSTQTLDDATIESCAPKPPPRRFVWTRKIKIWTGVALLALVGLLSAMIWLGVKRKREKANASPADLSLATSTLDPWVRAYFVASCSQLLQKPLANYCMLVFSTGPFVPHSRRRNSPLAVQLLLPDGPLHSFRRRQPYLLQLHRPLLLPAHQPQREHISRHQNLRVPLVPGHLPSGKRNKFRHGRRRYCSLAGLRRLERDFLEGLGLRGAI